MAIPGGQYAQQPATLDAQNEALTMNVASPAGESIIFAVQLAGTFSATITFEATIDGTNWVAIIVENLSDGALASTTTTAGLYRVVVSGLLQVRARASTYASGSISATGMVVS